MENGLAKATYTAVIKYKTHTGGGNLTVFRSSFTRILIENEFYFKDSIWFILNETTGDDSLLEKYSYQDFINEKL